MYSQPAPRNFIGTQPVMHSSAERSADLQLSREAALSEYANSIKSIVMDLNAESQARIIEYVKSAKETLAQEQKQILETVNAGIEEFHQNMEASAAPTPAAENRAVNNRAPTIDVTAPDPW